MASDIERPILIKVPSVSVIIPVFRDWSTLDECLASLLQQSYPREAYEIIVVNNEESKNVHLGSGVTVLTERTPGSYSARNSGIAYSNADVLAFIDADCVADPNWLDAGVALLRQAGRRSIVGGRIAFPTPAPWEQEDAVRIFQRARSLNQDKYVSRYQFAATANMLTWKEAFSRIGLFNPKLYSGGDAEWAGRGRNVGYRVEYAPQAIVFHQLRSTVSELQARSRRTAGGHFLRFVQLRGPWATVYGGPYLAIKAAIRGLRAASEWLWSPTRSWRLRLDLAWVELRVSLAQVIEYLRLGIRRSPRR